MICIVKNRNKYKATIGASSKVITVTHRYSTPSDTYVDIISINYLLRMGFTTNVYPISGNVYKTMVLVVNSADRGRSQSGGRDCTT